MKSKYALLGLSMLYSIFSFATHWRSGEITYRMIGNLQVEATVTIYTKYDGISIQADQDHLLINWGDGSSDSVCRSNGTVSGSGCHNGVIINVNPSVKRSDYTATHTYAGILSSGFFIISTMDMNRIDGINNINGGSGINVPWYLEDTLFINRMPSVNNGPILLNPPIDFANTNDTFTYNSAVYDADGDSIDFQLATPLQDRGMPVPLYEMPDQFCQAHSFPSNSFVLNRNTGGINWSNPCQMGIYNFAVISREYRCGILLSTTLRDMQLIVVNESNDPPVLSAVHDTVINPGDSISFSVTATDPQLIQTISLSAIGGGFQVSSPAIFQSTAGNPASGTFIWRTDALVGRKSPYIFSIIASDNYTIPGNPPISAPLKKYQTFRVWVTDTSECTFTSIEEAGDASHKTQDFRIHPNPANDVVTISVDDVSPSAEAIITDLSGRKMAAVPLATGNQQLSTEHLNSGVYFVTVATKEGRTATKKLVIQK